MQIRNINSQIPVQSQSKQQGYNKRKINYNNATSFKGIDSFCLRLANLIEVGGLAVSFTLQDMLGTNLPRPFMGLQRNKEENKGESNIAFMLKEATREFTTGPSMFLIPAGILKFFKEFGGTVCEKLGINCDIFGKASDVPSRFIKAFGDIHLNGIEKNNTQQEFFKNTFERMIKYAKGEINPTEETSKEAGKFAQKLMDGVTGKHPDGLNAVIEDLSSDFANLTKEYAKDGVHKDFTSANITENVTASFKKVISHMLNYADDVVQKSQKQAPEKISEYIKNLTDKKAAMRLGINGLMYACVLGFLQFIPKMYNKAEGDNNAGLKGLMKQETFCDKKLNERENQKNAAYRRNNNYTPAFGSLASNITKGITGNGKIAKFSDIMEFDGCNMSFIQLVALMELGIMYPRIKNAKDKYDKEEIKRRDYITCATMCVGAPWLRNAFSKMNELSAGLVLAEKGKNHYNKSIFGRFINYINPLNGISLLSSDQIRAKYSINMKNYKNEIKGICDFISAQGGDLRKVFTLTNESKNIFQTLLKQDGKTLADLSKQQTEEANKSITESIGKLRDSEELKNLADLFKPSKREQIKDRYWLDKLIGRTYKMIDNPWVTKARTLNARFTTLSVLVIVPGFLGFFLPWRNEKATKKLISQEQALNSVQRKNQNLHFRLMANRSKVFADMDKYVSRPA